MTTIPLSALTATWNASGTTFTGIGLNVTDTASASGSLLVDLQVGGTSQFYVRKDGFTRSAQNIEAAGGNFVGSTDSGGLFFGSSSDTVIRRDAANTVAQRNGTNAQAHRIYNTFTDSGASYERIALEWVSNVGYMRPQNAGTGSARLLVYNSGTTTVAALPAAATAGASARAFVTDALAPVFGSAVVGGGAVSVPVYSTGAAWNVG
jgi:hypothetical protein